MALTSGDPSPSKAPSMQHIADFLRHLQSLSGHHVLLVKHQGR